jgi:hypothetical protein
VLVVRVEEGELKPAESLLRWMYTGRLGEGVAGSASQLLLMYRLADRFQVGGRGGAQEARPCSRGGCPCMPSKALQLKGWPSGPGGP